MELKKIKGTDLTVMLHNGEHVLYRRVDGLHFIGMATIFNEIHISNLLEEDYRRMKDLKPSEKPKQWVYDFGPTFQQLPKEVLNQFIVN